MILLKNHPNSFHHRLGMEELDQIVSIFQKILKCNVGDAFANELAACQHGLGGWHSILNIV